MCFIKTILFAVSIVMFFSSCSHPGGSKPYIVKSSVRGVYHTVGKGETLWRISQSYGVDIKDVKKRNNIKDPAKIEAGDKIFIPGVKKKRKVSPAPESGASAKGNKKKNVPLKKGEFIWPVKGQVVSPYGTLDAVIHSGIDIKAERNTPVKASFDGKIVYSDNGIRGYGNAVIISHDNGFFTVYAGNEKNLVKKGDTVKKGAVIALVGSSGNIDAGAIPRNAPRLHFEIRDGRTSRNPIFFLP